jgi:hypothetical protein
VSQVEFLGVTSEISVLQVKFGFDQWGQKDFMMKIRGKSVRVGLHK